MNKNKMLALLLLAALLLAVPVLLLGVPVLAGNGTERGVIDLATQFFAGNGVERGPLVLAGNGVEKIVAATASLLS